jgi:hypothetical protein
MTARAACWSPLWSPGFEGAGFEHVTFARHGADSVLLAVDEAGEPFRLAYRLRWDDAGRLREADLESLQGDKSRRLALRADGEGAWHTAERAPLPGLEGCIDIDIWPTPLTNSLPLWRSGLAVGERREYRMAWVNAPALTVERKAQAYTRLAERRYRFESLDGSGFQVELPLDGHGLVTDYPGLFRRVAIAAA